MAASVQQLEALAVLAQLCLLAVAISIGQWLQRRKVMCIGSAGAALLLGVGVGLVVRLAGTAPLVASWLRFQSDFFFLVLLPPIMFHACFNLDVRLFINNLGSVCMLAFYGTTASTFAMGFNMWAAGKLGMCYELSLLHAWTFGALISATDPVTVLAVFQQLGAQPDLYMNVFGESVLNDAVAMVLFQTLSGFADQTVAVSAASILRGTGVFVGVFVGSLLLGVLLGFGAAAALRPGWFAGEVNNETGLMLLLGYASYMAGTAVGGSGIVCVMFCAMVAGSYAAPNLSPGGSQASRVLYAVLASVMEVYVFVAVGLSLFMQPQEWHTLRFLAVCLFGLAWSRAVNILPSCAAINYLRPPDMAISSKQQVLLWWAGLRGAMAFALSVEAARTMGEPGKVMMTATFMSILCTVLVNGGSTGYLLAYCGLTHKQQQHLPHEQEHVALLLPKEHSSSASLADTAGSSGSGAAASAASEFPMHRLRSSSHAADGSVGAPGELPGDSLRQATPVQPPARLAAGLPSEAGPLEVLREANRHGLQARLDSWHASLFCWFINPVSAAEHARWQATLPPQQQQQH